MSRPALHSAQALLCALVACFTVACSDAAPVAREAVDRATDSIINGTPDTTHPAVVLVAGANSACSGTIVHTNGSTGHVLTAAHCNNPQYILQGQDYNNPTATYPVTDALDHPSYNGQVYDFQMVRFTGAGSGTPVIAAMSPAEDNLVSGTQIRHVGYGKAGPPPGSNNTIRREILGNLDNVTPLTLSYDQPNGGPCSGDSGGPQLTIGTERVAGVTSAGDPNCASSGYSGRVSAVYDTFVIAYINNAPIGGMNCDQCTQAATTGMGACMTQVNACFNDGDCSALLTCFDGCSTQACYQQCFNSHPSGTQIYISITDCVCDSACTMECGMESFCQNGGPAPVTASASTSAATGAGAGGGSGVGVGAGAGAGVGANSGDGWVAGETPDQDIDGVLVGGCSMNAAKRGAPYLGALGARYLWAGLLLLCAITALRRRAATETPSHLV